MSDIEYLAIKKFDGKRVDVDATTTVVATAVETDLATQTASTGKDMYLARASLFILNNGSQPIADMKIQLYVNGTVVETIQTPSALAEFHEIKFKTIGEKVATTQIIKMTYTNTGSTTSRSSLVYSKLMLWEETTGATPAI